LKEKKQLLALAFGWNHLLGLRKSVESVHSTAEEKTKGISRRTSTIRGPGPPRNETVVQLIESTDSRAVALMKATGKESDVPIQLAQCRFPGLAIFGAKI